MRWVCSGREDICRHACISIDDFGAQPSVGVKRAKGKLSFDGSPLDVMEQMALMELPIGARHCEAAAILPGHHRDPFDRLLVAQAQVEDMTLATHDDLIRAYAVKILSA
jgi:PIN domain nuclease of toxin-antitoxin system